MSEEVVKKNTQTIPEGYIQHKSGKIVKKPSGRPKKVHKVLNEKDLFIQELEKVYYNKDTKVSDKISAGSLLSELQGWRKNIPQNTNEIAKNCITFKRSEPPKSYKNPTNLSPHTNSDKLISNIPNKMLDNSNIITKANITEIPNENANNSVNEVVNEVSLINDSIMTATNVSSSVIRSQDINNEFDEIFNSP